MSNLLEFNCNLSSRKYLKKHYGIEDYEPHIYDRDVEWLEFYLDLIKLIQKELYFDLVGYRTQLLGIYEKQLNKDKELVGMGFTLGLLFATYTKKHTENLDEVINEGWEIFMKRYPLLEKIMIPYYIKGSLDKINIVFKILSKKDKEVINNYIKLMRK